MVTGRGIDLLPGDHVDERTDHPRIGIVAIHRVVFQNRGIFPVADIIDGGMGNG